MAQAEGLLADCTYASDLVAEYITELEIREPPYLHSAKEKHDEWSHAKSAATIIFERIIDGFDPIVVVEDMAAQMDYFSYKASEAGRYDTSKMFAIGSDVAMELLGIFTDNGIRCEEDYTI